MSMSVLDYIDFDKQMSMLSGVTTELEFEKLKEMILITARNTTYSTVDIASYAESLANEGHTCSEIIDRLAGIWTR